MRTRAVTRADVARYAGVSTAVVSYVVNNGPKPVAAHTAARVREAIDLLNYRPNVNAQALRRGTTEMLGLILSDATNPFFVELATAVGSAAHARGYAMMMGASNGDGATEGRLIDDLIRRQVDGLLVASVYQRPTLQHGLASNVPVVWLDNFHDVPGLPQHRPGQPPGCPTRGLAPVRPRSPQHRSHHRDLPGRPDRPPGARLPRRAARRRRPGRTDRPGRMVPRRWVPGRPGPALAAGPAHCHPRVLRPAGDRPASSRPRAGAPNPAGSRDRRLRRHQGVGVLLAPAHRGRAADREAGGSGHRPARRRTARPAPPTLPAGPGHPAVVWLSRSASI